MKETAGFCTAGNLVCQENRVANWRGTCLDALFIDPNFLISAAVSEFK
ncbi:hypothetical protein A2U01_0017210, partial [Trifolium medium]|nr:hypothetical protein [Trifolium medium]